MSRTRLGGLGATLVFTLLVGAHGACSSSDPVISDANDGAAPPSPTDDAEVPSAIEDGAADAGRSDADAGDSGDADSGDANDGATPPPVCGNGVIEGDEECEDGALVSGDGCDATCHVEHGFECAIVGQPCTPTVCGDGLKRGTEECDDGNHDWGDACTPLCTHAPSCTNGVCTPICGDGILSAGEACDDGNNRPFDGCSATCTIEPGFSCPPGPGTAPVMLPLVHRDFRGYDLLAAGALPRGHIDFENANAGSETGIVAAMLGANGKPVYAKEGVASASTHGKVAFDQWFRDVDKVNIPVMGTISLAQSSPGGAYQYVSSAYFPLDGAGFVAAMQEPKRADASNTPRNFSFTSESRAWFVYTGSEVFTIAGDDDLWVFINGHLALDLGGVHGPVSGTVTLSQKASQLGNLTVGGTYEMAIFRAERHTNGSTFTVAMSSRPLTPSVCTKNAP